MSQQPPPASSQPSPSSSAHTKLSILDGHNLRMAIASGLRTGKGSVNPPDDSISSTNAERSVTHKSASSTSNRKTSTQSGHGSGDSSVNAEEIQHGRLSAALYDVEQRPQLKVSSKSKRRKSAEFMAVVRGGDVSTFEVLQHRFFLLMNHVFTDAVVGVYSACYLAIICIDMIADDIITDQDVKTDKDRVIVRIDLGFLTLFLMEITCRIMGQGCSYLRKWKNVADLTVVVTGLVLDLLVLSVDLGSQMLFLRLARVLRVARMGATLSRLVVRRQIIRSNRQLTKVVSPPKCNWQGARKRLGPKKRFAAFLSHTKSESATDARYLHDLLQLLLQTDVYLDSSNLTDLRQLFDDLCESEVLVLIASPSVLHSPWCLLEIWKAGREGIPVIVVAKPGFSASGAQRFLQSLHTELDAVNPGALEEVLVQAAAMTAAENPPFLADDAVRRGSSTPGGRERADTRERDGLLGGRGSDPTKAAAEAAELREALRTDRRLRNEHAARFKRVVIEALGLDASRASAEVRGEPALAEASSVGGPRMVKWAPHASDEQILASMVDLVELMAEATERQKLKWTREGGERPAAAPDAAVGRWPCVPRWARREEKRRYRLFICYAPAEARGVARFLQLALQRALRGPVVEEMGADLDGVHHPQDDLDELLHAIERSEAVLLVQTASVLYRPWTLLQVYTALCLQKPLVCVHVEGGGYDHHAAKQLLLGLREELDDRSPGAYAATRKLLHERNLSFDRMQQALLASIPAIISISFASGGSSNHADAVVQDITSRILRHLNRAAELPSTYELPEEEEEEESSPASPASHGLGRKVASSLEYALERAARRLSHVAALSAGLSPTPSRGSLSEVDMAPTRRPSTSSVDDAEGARGGSRGSGTDAKAGSRGATLAV